MRVIVTGSRDWLGSIWQLHAALGGVLMISTAMREPLTIVEGGASGIDSFARSWTTSRSEDSVVSETHPADWAQHGKWAGPFRNNYMASLGADLCLAFLYEPEGKVSKGTRDMIRQAELYKIPVLEFRWKEEA